MPRLRFVHAADLHLDNPFRSIRSGAPSHVADALLVAGDIYDGADQSLRAQLRFVQGLRQLDEAGIRSFICHGNHDPLDGWEARLDLPAGCCRFGPEVEDFPVFQDEPERAMVHGVSYPTLEVRENLTPYFAGTGTGQGFNRVRRPQLPHKCGPAAGSGTEDESQSPVNRHPPTPYSSGGPRTSLRPAAGFIRPTACSLPDSFFPGREL